MNLEKIESAYTQFRDATQNTFQIIDKLIDKMQNAARNGDSQAEEWAEDLQRIVDNMKNGQGHIGDLFQNFHGIMQVLDHKEEKKASEDSSASDFLSNFLNTDPGKSLESGDMEKINRKLLDKFLK